MAGRMFRSHLGRAIRFHVRVGRAALHGAAVVVRNQAKRNVRGGFTSGNFVTGNLMNKISHEIRGDGPRMMAVVGTTVKYGAYWELGHFNRFVGGGVFSGKGTRRYMRVEWLKPAMTKTVAEQQRAARAAAKSAANLTGAFVRRGL